MSCARLTAPYYMKKPTVTDRKVMPFCERKTLERKSREKELGYFRKRFCHPLKEYPPSGGYLFLSAVSLVEKLLNFMKKGMLPIDKQLKKWYYLFND